MLRPCQVAGNAPTTCTITATCPLSDSCRPCCEEAALETEEWVISLAELLSSTIWSESTVVNKALLRRLQNLVEQIGEGKSGAARHELFRLNSPQRRRLELMLTEYLNRFIVRIRDNELYVVKQLQHGNTVLDDFAVYSSNKFKAAFQANAWTITGEVANHAGSVCFGSNDTPKLASKECLNHAHCHIRIKAKVNAMTVGR